MCLMYLAVSLVHSRCSRDYFIIIKQPSDTCSHMYFERFIKGHTVLSTHRYEKQKVEYIFEAKIKPGIRSCGHLLT